MTKPWQTSAWKKKRAEFLKDKSCEWCGSTKSLTPHHKRQSLPYELHYKVVSGMMLRKLIKEGVYKSISKEACPKCYSFSIYARKTISPKYRCIRCENTFEYPYMKATVTVAREDWLDFQSKYKEKIKEIVRSQRQKQYEEYMTLEDTLILCKRCHFAIGKGLVLCELCKKHYHRPSYDMCWQCFSRTERGQRITWSKELLPYVHPWCGKTFQIEREWWDLEAEPHQCCMEHCDVDLHQCEIADKHWYNENQSAEQ